MPFGLTDLHISKICSIFQKYPQINRAVLYGSRAKGNYKPGSDIDLTLYGETLTTHLLAQIADDLDELLLPFMIDLSIFENLNNVNLKAHIEQIGVLFYVRIDQKISPVLT
jgi:predicted nucleotidyltransferase